MKKYQLKDFSQFLEEVTIKGNEGIPGEGNDRDEKKYLSDVERRARQRVGAPRDEDPRFGPPHMTMQTGRELMELLQRSQQMTRGKEDELEALAQEVILREYGSILDNVDLDIKLIRPGEVKQFMDDEGCEGGNCQMPSYQLLNDPEIKKEVDKRKIINNITQGEAKNTKRILAMPEVREEIISIFGGQGEEVHRMWTRMTELADKMDWLIPVDIKGDMMEQAPEGMAGAVSVKWPEAEEKEGEEKEEKSDAEKQQELADKILKGLEEDGDLDTESEDLQELMATGNPIIKARGVDFPMLLHETVKGIYELIAAAGIPEDKRTAELVMLNTSSFEDEAEEFRYGPEIAADLRDFINKSTKEIDKYPNIREHVCGVLYKLEADEFLSTMKKILLETPEGREIVDNIIDDVIKQLDDYELGEALPSEREEEFESEPEGDTTTPEGEESESEIDKLVKQSASRESERDLSDYTQREIQDLIDAALDAGDFDEVRRLSEYLKEGKEIFLNEIEKINESHSHHGRRK